MASQVNVQHGFQQQLARLLGGGHVLHAELAAAVAVQRDGLAVGDHQRPGDRGEHLLDLRREDRLHVGVGHSIRSAAVSFLCRPGGSHQIYNCRKRNALGSGCRRIGAAGEYCRSIASRRSVRNRGSCHVHDFGNCRILATAASLGDDQATYELDVFCPGRYQLDVVFYARRLRALRKRAGVDRLRAGLFCAHAR